MIPRKKKPKRKIRKEKFDAFGVPFSFDEAPEKKVDERRYSPNNWKYPVKSTWEEFDEFGVPLKEKKSK